MADGQHTTTAPRVDWDRLRAAALAATEHAYVPYSGFRVGAAALAEDGRLRPAAELAERFDAVGVDDATPVAVYCGSGITAAHAVLTLAVAGRPGVALYPGSWSAWVQDPSNAVAVGPEPYGASGRD